jgi:phosphoglucosamine mutase
MKYNVKVSDMGNLFGTDGIRGVANAYPLIPEIAVGVGRAVVFAFQSKSKKTKIVIGKDTRISGVMLEYALASGVCSMGAEARLAGTLPTPGVAYATSCTDADAGIVISASHNPFYDNGIKLFDAHGNKLSDELEQKIEQLVLTDQPGITNTPIQETGDVVHLKDASRSYKEFLKNCITEKSSLQGIKIVLDCSNGATYGIAPDLFDELGARVDALSIRPDGKNINAGCGSEHPQALISEVLKRNADIGLAFDGDGDRLIAVDDKGQVITGDRILAICAKVLKQKRMLKNNLVVSTVMSNLGLRIALKKMGIKHVMTKVGDRYVLEEMRASGATIGGEDSGHMIFSDHHTTGDGMLTALKLIEAMQTESKPLSELSAIMTVFPQVLINVDVRHKPEIQSVPEVVDAIKTVENKLGEQGRVLVRYSGTQPLCRIMVEASSEEDTKQYCMQISEIIKEKIGS